MFWCPVSVVQPTEKGKVHARRRQAVVKVIPKDAPTDWDDRPLAEGVAAAHRMS